MSNQLPDPISEECLLQQDNVRVAVISDTHGYLDPRVAEIVWDCDAVVHAGDVCGEQVINELVPKSGVVKVVAGNNDAYCHETWLPSVARLNLPGGQIVIEHGHRYGGIRPSHQAMRQAYADARAIIYGHTHRLTEDYAAEPWVLNPGAAGRTRTENGPSCLVLCASEKHWFIEKFRFNNN